MKKKACLLLLALLSFTISYSQVSENKNRFVINLEIYGLPLTDTEEPMGTIVSLGYDIIPVKKNLFFSIEPRIGGGGFGNNVTKRNSVVYQYSMACYSFGVAPKVYVSLDPDDEFALYLENDISFLNSFAKIRDKGQENAQTRKENEFLHLYYSCKLGALLRGKKHNFSFWAGYTTLDFINLLNRHLPSDRKRFSAQYLGICFGTSISL